MKKLSFFALLVSFLLVSSCNNENEFESIFNGTDLSGWEVKNVDIDEAKEYWYVEDGLLHANSMGDSIHNYIWLQYNEELSDFHLKLKFRPIQGNPGNTGIQIRSRYDEEEQWLNGPQLDIHPPGPWRTGMMWDETRGYQRWIFPDLPNGEWVNPEMAISSPEFHYAGESAEWNEMEVIAKGTKITAFLNGIQITDFNGEGILDDSIHANLNVGMKGFICLQIHITDQLEIHYKDIELKKVK
jgi:hypothetical protein